MKVAVLGEANRSEIVDAPMSRMLFIAPPAATPGAYRESPTFERVNEDLSQNTRAPNGLVQQRAFESTAKPGLQCRCQASMTENCPGPSLAIKRPKMSK